MGFFADLKQDLSQAVNELLPEPVQTIEESVAVPEKDAQEAVPTSEQAAQGGMQVSNPAVQEAMQIPNPAAQEAVQVSNPEAQQTGQIPKQEAQETVKESHPEEMPTEAGWMYRESDGALDAPEENTVEQLQENMRIATDELAVITAGMQVAGDIFTQGSVDILGIVGGNVDVYGRLNVTGRIQGDCHAAEVYAENAAITGNIVSDGDIRIGIGCVIIGNITATGAVIAGAIKGDVDVNGPVLLESTAVVMGNIKSKSVQIDNGAVIEGLCSQCYADVSPSDLFKGYI